MTSFVRYCLDVHTLCETHFELQTKSEVCCPATPLLDPVVIGTREIFYFGDEGYFVGDNGWEKDEEPPEPKVDSILPSSFDDND